LDQLAETLLRRGGHQAPSFVGWMGPPNGEAAKSRESRRGQRYPDLDWHL